MTRPVYLHGTTSHSAAGEHDAALADACLSSVAPTRASVSFRSPAGDVNLPYFRMPPCADPARKVATGVHVDAAIRGSHRTGLYIGSTSSGIAEHERLYSEALTGGVDAIPIRDPDQSRTAQDLHAHFAMQGPHYTLSTACSSAANALLYAALALRHDQLDDALVVGVEQENGLSQQGFFGMMLATREYCRPFDRERSGIVLGEGAAALHLSTRRDGARWQLLGGASSCDTQHPTNPAPDKIAATMRMALADAGVRASEITAIKAHGTATRANDLSEALGVTLAFGRTPPPFTSLKPVLGHTLGACGALETVAFLACLNRGFVPQTHNFNTPDPELGISPLREVRAWRGGAVLLNYFGFGGNNCSLVLQQIAPC